MSESDYFERLVDRDTLSAFLEDELGPADRFEIEHHQEGHSNETLFVDWGDHELVIRRPPAGETADAAHEVLREYRVMDALQDTDVPVPRTIAGCDDHSIIGSDFYVMERLDGDVIRDEEPERFADPEQRRLLSEEFIDTVAEIHTLDPEAVGLDDMGHPDGYTERQVERWTKQLEWAFEVTENDRPVPELRDVAEWLDENVPDDYDHTLVHGDYKLDNVMFGRGGPDASPEERAGDAREQAPPDLVGVFDWEMCTRGDPSMDLGWMLISWPDAKDPEWDDPLSNRIETREGYMTRLELLDRYEETTGLSFDHERFYRTFGVFKAAGACEMMYRRYLEGNSDNPAYPLMEERVPAMAERAMRIIEGEEPL
jgi:aminoglycoside phosphotransferase (APT) family kinase protein